MKIQIISQQEKIALDITKRLNVSDMSEYKLILRTVCMVMDMHDDTAEELLEQIQDMTETEDGDFRCSTCDHVNSLIKNR